MFTGFVAVDEFEEGEVFEGAFDGGAGGLGVDAGSTSRR